MTTATETTLDISVESVRVVLELYPRTETKMIESLVQQYQDALDDLPAIIVARDSILVDGMHRLTAHKRAGRSTIKAIDLGNLSDAEIYDAALKYNNQHGRQLSRKEKQSAAGRKWRDLAHLKPGDRAAHIAQILSMSTDAVYDATKNARDQEKKEQQEKTWDLWLNCLTQDRIAEEMGVEQKTISNWISKFRQLPEFTNPPSKTDKQPWGNIQHFDIWTFAKANGDSSYFGQMPPQVVENLLWFYTEPGQTVFDPFAGGGTTIKVAKEMGRRVWSSDIAPSTPMLPIHEHSILDGWPSEAPKQADFILLDPPYWQQALGKYGDHEQNLSNMPLDAFYDAWETIVKTCSAHIAPKGRIAYIISPTQCEDGSVIDHTTDMLAACWKANLKVERRIIVPYSTQQATGQQVTWARENRRLLKLYRDLVILIKK